MTEPKTATALPIDEQSDRRTTVLLAVTGVMPAGLIHTVMARDEAVSCPNELIGAWETSAKGYEGSMLVFTKTDVAFRIGAGHLDAQAVRRLKVFPEGPRTPYTVIYGDSRRDEQILSFYYHTKEQTITFKNQSHLVWNRNALGL